MTMHYGPVTIIAVLQVRLSARIGIESQAGACFAKGDSSMEKQVWQTLLDLHLATSKDALSPGAVFSAEDTGGHPAVFVRNTSSNGWV